MLRANSALANHRSKIRLKNRVLRLFSVMTLAAGLFVALPFVGVAIAEISDNDPGRAIPEHDQITEYTGPETCVACHQTEAEEMFGSVHYQWTGPTPNATNISGSAGKGELGFNTYCGTPAGSRRVSCSGCHVGNGGAPDPVMTQDQLHNIDCLMCHQEDYARKAAPPYENVTYTGHDSVERTWTLPVEDASGSYIYEPDETAMGITILEAAQTVHQPTRATCLSCHAYAAGSDCGKRGDLGTGSVDPPLTADIHMSSAGANLLCQDCHETDNHRVMGRGLDLRPNDRSETLTCTSASCHTERPHGNTRRDDHTARVACQTCHIPVFAKQATTETARDWNIPFFAAGMFGGQGGFKPEEFRASNLTPSYRWYDGTSRVYALGQVPETDSAGRKALGTPNGSVTSRTARIHPMKEHLSNSAQHVATGQLIPHSTFTYFMTGDFNQAVADGQAHSGLTGAWNMVDVHTFQTINHGVEDHENALDCGSCHDELEGGPLRMDLQSDFGYQLKGPQSQVCIQCHSNETPEGLVSTHNKHVREEGIDCLWCHEFSRPDGTTMEADFSCDPSEGTVPFQTQMTVSLTNRYSGQTRRVSARLNAMLAGGSSYSNWRSGSTNIAAGETFVTSWNQNIPALGSLIGQNTFTLEAEDTTPAPYNQLPYPPSGVTDTTDCTVTATAP